MVTGLWHAELKALLCRAIGRLRSVDRLRGTIGRSGRGVGRLRGAHVIVVVVVLAMAVIGVVPL